MQNILTKRTLLISIAAGAVVFGTTGARAADPTETANQVYQIYVDTLAQTNEAFAGAPEYTAELGAQFDVIKEASVTKLVALGHEIAAMSDGDRTTVEGKVGAMVSGIDRKPETADIWSEYYDVLSGYARGDQDFFKKIQSLNILTQYAFFGLLRKQAPAEAERLGV